jgi:hypothetical protein
MLLGQGESAYTVEQVHALAPLKETGARTWKLVKGFSVMPLQPSLEPRESFRSYLKSNLAWLAFSSKFSPGSRQRA